MELQTLHAPIHLEAFDHTVVVVQFKEAFKKCVITKMNMMFLMTNPTTLVKVFTVMMKGNSFRFLLGVEDSQVAGLVGSPVFPVLDHSLAVDLAAAKALHLQAHHHLLHRSNNSSKHSQSIQAQSPDVSFDLRTFG